MNPKKVFTKEEEGKIVSAIREAELKTSGEIRVHLAQRCRKTPHEEAVKIFEKLGMTKTAERNGILFYLAIQDRKFSVIGDKGIHEKVGPDFWHHVRDGMQAEFQKGELVQGLVEGIRICGEQLVLHFPRREDDVNELPDEISKS